MRRIALTALAASLVIAGCSKDDSNGATPARLERAARAYAKAFRSGDSDSAFAMQSSRCRKVIPRELFDELVSAAATAYKDQPLRDLGVRVSGTKGVATYSFDDEELNQTDERWVLDERTDTWRNDDCPNSLEVPTTSASANAPR